MSPRRTTDELQDMEDASHPELSAKAKAKGRRFLSGLAQNWSSPHAELQVVQKRHGKHSWQARALCFIHSHRFQQTLMILLLLDVLILFAEIFLIATYPPCFVVEKEAVSCCLPESSSTTEEDHGRWLSGGGETCEYPLEPSGVAGCDPNRYPAAHTAELVLFSLTIVILSTFLLELVVLLIVLGVRAFSRNRLYVTDVIIVVSSLALEITFSVLEEEDLASLTGLLIIGRIWRFVRIGHGLFSTTMEVSLAKIEELEHQIEELKLMLDETSAQDVSDEDKESTSEQEPQRSIQRSSR